MQVFLIVVHAVVIPLVLSVLVRLAKVVEMNDSFDFPNMEQATVSFETACKNAARNDYFLQRSVFENYIEYLRAYVRHYDEEEKYRHSKGGKVLADFFGLESLIISWIFYFNNQKFSLIIKIICGIVAVAIYASVVIELFDVKAFPRYIGKDYYKDKLFVLNSLSQNSTEKDAEEYFDTLHLNHRIVLEARTRFMISGRARATIFRFIIFAVAVLIAYIYLPH